MLNADEFLSHPVIALEEITFSVDIWYQYFVECRNGEQLMRT